MMRRAGNLPAKGARWSVEATGERVTGDSLESYEPIDLVDGLNTCEKMVLAVASDDLEGFEPLRSLEVVRHPTNLGREEGDDGSKMASRVGGAELERVGGEDGVARDP
jgi:hypothetical protein